MKYCFWFCFSLSCCEMFAFCEKLMLMFLLLKNAYWYAVKVLVLVEHINSLVNRGSRRFEWKLNLMVKPFTQNGFKRSNVCLNLKKHIAKIDLHHILLGGIYNQDIQSTFYIYLLLQRVCSHFIDLKNVAKSPTVK